MGKRNPFRAGPPYGREVWPWLLYAGLALLAFSPCLLFGRAYFDNDLLAQFGPWRAFLKDQLSQGHFPLWNPYSLGGQPFFADLQNMMLYPVNYLTLPFSVPYGLSVFFFLHMFWSAAGMHLWLRSMGLSESACRAGALLFALSNFFWLELIHPPVLAAFSWLPWLFLRLELLAQSPKPRNAFFAGLCFAMLFLCGSFQVTVGALYGGLAYFFYRFWPKISIPNSPDRLRSALALTLVVLWGALPLLAQFIPTLEFSRLSDRASAPQTYGQLTPHTSLNPATLYQFLFPRFDLKEGLSMAEAVQSHDPGPDLSANWGYLGPWIPFLVFWAFRGKNKNFAVFFIFFALLSLGLCLGRHLPIHRLFFEWLPGFSLIRVPFRFLFLYVLGISVLVAFGFEAWRSQPRPKNPLDRLKGPILYAFVLYLTALFRPGENWREIGALALGLAGISLGSGPPRWKTVGSLLFQTSLILPLFFSGWGDFIPGPSSNFDYARNSKTIGEIAQRVRPYRLIFDNSHMEYPIEVRGQKYLLNYPQNAACALKIKNFGGYNPLMLQAKRDIGGLGMESLIGVGAVKGIVTQQDHGPIPGFKLESFPPYLLYEYQKPLSYIYEPTYIELIPDSPKRLEALGNPDFDISKRIIFSETPHFEIKPPHPSLGSHLSYQLGKDEADRQSFAIDMDGDHWLVFPEVNFPGWKAWSDGQPTPIFTADHFLRSIYLPAGHHRVEFRFRPGWLHPIQIGLILWLLITSGFFVLGPMGTGRK